MKKQKGSWKDDDKVVLSFGTLKNAQEDSFLEGTKHEFDRVVKLLFDTWDDLGSQALGGTEFHDGIGYGIEDVLCRLMGVEAYYEVLTAKATLRAEKEPGCSCNGNCCK